MTGSQFPELRFPKRRNRGFQIPDSEDTSAGIFTRKHLERIVSDWDEVPLVSCEMAVILRETQEKIGRTRFHMDEETDTAMLGWLLIQSFWGQHLATEMTRAMIDYAFDTIGVHRVSALCNPDNNASCLMEGDGELRDAARGTLQEEGQIRQARSPELGGRA